MIRGAILDFIQYRDRITVEESEDAERWLFGDGEGIVSFDWACEVAGVHADTVRRAALLVELNPDQAHIKMTNDWDSDP